MTTAELQMWADRARASIRALWATRHDCPVARARVHHWIRVIRWTEGHPNRGLTTKVFKPRVDWHFDDEQRHRRALQEIALRNGELPGLPAVFGEGE